MQRLRQSGDPVVQPRVAATLTLWIVPLAALASALGLWMPGLYRDTAWTVPQIRGQDLVTLAVAAPGLILTRHASMKGSPGGTILWAGLLGYVWYTYTGAAFAYRFNELFLVYVALFSLSTFALAAVAVGIDVERIRMSFDATVPRAAVPGFLLVFALTLAALWLAQIVPFLTSGALPELLIRAETPTSFVYVLDLGFVVPVAVLAAIWLRRERPWGFVLAGYVLIKAATMGLALLSMTWFMIRAGFGVDGGLAPFWLVLTLGSSSMLLWLFQHCHGADATSSNRQP